MGKFKRLVLQSIFFAQVLLITACASMQQPSGGPKDTQPPKIVKTTPKNLSTQFSSKTIEIEFDEFVKLSNEFTEISISPATEKMPIFKAKKELLEIKFDEALDSNTTYTINFGKAVADVNESNVLKNYSYVFSTGDKIDSLSISGRVRNSLTKDSLLDATVFILPVKQDTLFGKKRASIFTSTDSAGNFTLQNLREGDYLIYALKEESPDRIYNSPNEEIGFLSDTIRLNKNLSGLEISVFKQLPEIFAVKEQKIEADGRIVLIFNKPLPDVSLNILAPANLVNTKKTVELNSIKDSAFLWLPDLTFDSLKVSVSSNSKPVDTIQINRTKRDAYNRAVSVYDNLTTGTLKPGTNPIITLSSPIAAYDISKFTVLEDSVATSGLQVIRDTASTRKYQVKYAWKPKREYILKLAASAFTDVYGNKSKAYNKEFTLDSEENYGSIAIAVTVPDTSKSYLMEWLNNEGKILRTDIINKNTTINYIRYHTAK